MNQNSVPPEEKRITTTVGIPQGLLRTITETAKSLEISRSEYVVRLIRAAHNDQKAKLTLLRNDKVMSAFMNAMSEPGVIRAMADALSYDLTEEQSQHLLGFLRNPEGPQAHEDLPPDKPRSKKTTKKRT